MKKTLQYFKVYVGQFFMLLNEKIEEEEEDEL